MSLRRAWNRLRSVPGLKRDVTAVTVLVAIGASAAGYLVAHYGIVWPFQNNYTFSAEFSSAPGVSPSNHQTVRIAGVPVGSITGAAPTDRGTSIVTMTVDDKYPIFTNARLVLRTKNPVNEMYIEVNPGGPPAPRLPEDGTIPVTQTERPVQSYEVLDKLDARARGALTSLIEESDTALAHAPRDLPDGLNSLDDAAVQVRPVFEALDSRRETIAKLVTALSEIAQAVGQNDDRLTSLADSTDTTLSTLGRNSGNLEAALAALPGVTQDLQHTMHSVNDLTGQLNPTLDDLDNASGPLKDALKQTTDLADTLGDTVDAARPVVDKARSTVHDLRPIVRHVDASFHDLSPVTGQLPDITSKLVTQLNDVAAFVYNTASMASNRDANGHFFRGEYTNTANDPLGLGSPKWGGNS